jgi:hypothetical protein
MVEEVKKEGEAFYICEERGLPIERRLGLKSAKDSAPSVMLAHCK